jgi:hypothetical protein
LAKSRTLLYIAVGTDHSGKEDKVWVYKKGRSYYLSGSGIDAKEHLCHPSVRDTAGIRREIFLVFQIKVDRVIEPDELNH